MPNVDVAAEQASTGTTSSPQLADVCRLVAGYVLATRPTARRCRILIDFPDGDATAVDVVAVPLTARTPRSLRDRILAKLGDLKPGAWMGGQALACECEVDDYRNGHFQRTLKELKGEGKINTDPSLGYSLKHT